MSIEDEDRWARYRREMRSVPCTDCGVAAGKPCKTSGGNYTNSHRSRSKAYRERWELAKKAST